MPFTLFYDGHNMSRTAVPTSPPQPPALEQGTGAILSNISKNMPLHNWTKGFNSVLPKLVWHTDIKLFSVLTVILQVRCLVIPSQCGRRVKGFSRQEGQTLSTRRPPDAQTKLIQILL